MFQALINDVLREMVNQFVFVYLDHILIFFKDLSYHKRHVRAVLLGLLQNNLFVLIKTSSRLHKKASLVCHRVYLCFYIFIHHELEKKTYTIRFILFCIFKTVFWGNLTVEIHS